MHLENTEVINVHQAKTARIYKNTMEVLLYSAFWWA
jgi:hypothetical protein